MIDNKIADKTTKVSKTSQQNNSEIVTNEHNKEITDKEITFPEERQKTTDDLRLTLWHNNGISKNDKFVR